MFFFQKVKNIPEVLMIATFIKSNPTHFTYFNTFLSTELKKIIESAILKINEITKSERELVFSRQQFSELLQFLDNSPGFRMFYHPKEDFMCLAKNKIHLQDSMVLTPQLAG